MLYYIRENVYIWGEKMPTFLHTADLHLDTAFSANLSTEQAVIRRSEMLRCFSSIIDKAKDVDIFLISGDIFDSSYVSKETVSFLKRRFAEIPDTHIFICCGNHDPYTQTSIYMREEFSENVHIFKNKWECIELSHIKTRIYGASLSNNCDNLTESFPEIEKEEGVTDIILMHGDVVSDNAESAYNPITKSFIENCKADYLALGHIHKRTEISRLGKTYYAYSGMPEGRGFDECGDMGYYIGVINEGVADVKFERSCIRRLFRLVVDISGASDTFDALNIIKEAALGHGDNNDMYRIYLCGRVMADSISFDVIEKEIKGMLYYVELIDDTKESYDIENIASQNNLCGEFVRHMRNAIENSDDEDRKIMEDALILGIEALTGGAR